MVGAVREARAKYDERRKFDSNGMASERWRLEVIMRERALATALLSTPDVLAAVEAHPDAMEALAAVRRLGEAMREYRRVRGREHVERFAARTEVDDANDAVYALADRLAARKGE